MIFALITCAGPVEEHEARGSDSVDEGVALAARYCVQCHGMPNPRQLPKQAWPELFAAMNVNARRWPDEGTHEAKAHAGHQSWDETANKIMLNYFIRNALSERRVRKSLRKPSATVLTDAQFQPTPLTIPPAQFLTMLDYDPKRREIYYGLGRTVIEKDELKIVPGNALLIMNQSWKILSTTEFPNAPIHIEFERNSFRLTLIGEMGKDIGKSEVINVAFTESGLVETRLLTDLTRAVGSRMRDFDGDGYADILVSGFGGNGGSGELTIYWGKEDGKSFTAQVIFPGSGSLDAEVADFDGDGTIDILVLVTQQSQQLRLYLNRGERRFEERILIQRPIGWGYMDLEVVDFDMDGDLDVVTIAGNNMEFGMPPLKPYHGIRIWINDGEGSLSEKFFYPLYGAAQCVIADVDGDGDLDIAVTAFTPDWEAETPETFVLLVQTSPLTLQPYHPPQSSWRRWTFLAKGDRQENGATRLFVAHSWLPFGAPKNLRSSFEKDLELPGRVYSLDFTAP